MSKWKALSAVGLIAIASYEGCIAVNGGCAAYRDIAGIWTDGFGNTHGVTPGRPVPVPQSLQQLGRNVKAAEDAVNRCVTSYMGQQTFDAFVSFTYNVGGGAFCKSTMVKKFNAGDKHAACNELQRWTYAGGKKLPGLVARRERERKMCLEGLQ